MIKTSSIPYSIVRATQFFEFLTSIVHAATTGDTVRLPPAIIQPIAADDAATQVARTSAGSPINGTVEVTGPEQFRLDELVRRVLSERHDAREVVTDPKASYFGLVPGEESLLPGDDAIIYGTRIRDWQKQLLQRAG
jgi:uncharacterized protein YbjT (DUF2867 family)